MKLFSRHNKGRPASIGVAAVQPKPTRLFGRKDPRPKVMAKTRGFDPSENPAGRRVIFLSAIVVGLAFMALIGRLWYLQILQGETLRALSENNRLRLLDVAPSRGLIFDAKGRLLADNRPGFSLAVIPEDVNDWDELAHRLEKLVGITPEELNKARDSAKGQPPFKAIRLRSHLDREQLAVLETFRYELAGIKVQVEHRRSYLAARETAHIIGYLGEINQNELSGAAKGVYRMGDFVGRYGIEKSRERVLHGKRGARQVEVDALGRELNLLEEVDAVQGHNLTLTIDLDMQRAAQAALGDEVGAVVAMDPKSGQVYCLYSSPSFDQNTFITGMSSRLWEALSNDPFHPLKDRAISGLYPPGSTYKIITAAAGLAEGVITPSTIINCPGEIPFGGRMYKCWALKKGGHGNTDLHKALRESCDVYFYRVGMRLGVERLAKYARAFGLGRPTGVPLGSESAGLVPDNEWKKKRFGEPWQDGETLSLSIGQGFNLTTPIQLARMVSVVANGGLLVTPTLVKTVHPNDRSEPVPEPPGMVGRVPVNPKDVQSIHNGLVAVANEPGGTASAARLPGIHVAGKTGTSQIVSLAIEKAYGNEANLPWKYKNHALFVGYAPAEDPSIAVAVVVEHGGHGGSDAAPVARKVMEAFFGVTPRPEKPKETPGPLRDHPDPQTVAAQAQQEKAKAAQGGPAAGAGKPKPKPGQAPAAAAVPVKPKPPAAPAQQPKPPVAAPQPKPPAAPVVIQPPRPFKPEAAPAEKKKPAAPSATPGQGGSR